MPEWYDALPDDLAKEWQKCVNFLMDLGRVPIPRRRISCDPPQQWKCELHVFTDSSQDVAAAAAYLGSYCDVGCHVHILAAKTKVLSKSEVARGSISRKKLVAAEIGMG